MTNNTIPNVPRELLDSLLTVIESNGYAADEVEVVDELRTLLSAPSPAGVDGCRCSMSISVLGDGCRYCQPQEYIDRLGEMLDEERSELSDAQAIIDGLRGEVAELQSMLAIVSKAGIRVRTERDQQAQRIGELEGLLYEASGELRTDRHHGLGPRINAALYDVKEGE